MGERRCAGPLSDGYYVMVRASLRGPTHVVDDRSGRTVCGRVIAIWWQDCERPLEGDDLCDTCKRIATREAEALAGEEEL